MRGLEGIAAVRCLAIIVDSAAATNFEVTDARRVLAFDFYFGCGFFLGNAPPSR